MSSKTPWISFKTRQRVYDRWYPEIAGRIVEVLKTRLRVQWVVR